MPHFVSMAGQPAPARLTRPTKPTGRTTMIRSTNGYIISGTDWRAVS
jgi:hypothetical protein